MQDTGPKFHADISEEETKLSRRRDPYAIWKDKYCKRTKGVEAIALQAPLPFLTSHLHLALMLRVADDRLWGSEVLCTVVDNLWEQHFAFRHNFTFGLFVIEAVLFTIATSCLRAEHQNIAVGDEESRFCASVSLPAILGRPCSLYGVEIIMVFFAIGFLLRLVSSNGSASAPRYDFITFFMCLIVRRIDVAVLGCGFERSVG